MRPRAGKRVTAIVLPICLLGGVALLRAGNALADPLTYLVGTDAACDFATLQGAIDAAAINPGFDTIRVARNANYVAQALTVAGQVLDITGGYETCASAQPTPGTRTTISGAGGGNDSVLTITGTGNDVVLTGLTITRGDEVADGFGGGIDFRGAGFLTLRRITVIDNYAGYGGGINVSATGDNAELRVEAGTVIFGNTAQFSGGGIRLWGQVGDLPGVEETLLRMVDGDISVAGNEALGINPGNGEPLYGYGGGIEVVHRSQAIIGSPGSGNLGVIYDNRARYGGGIAVIGEDGDRSTADVRLFTTDAQRPVRIQNNQATHAGGGVYLRNDDPGSAQLCAFDFRIEGNRAQEGSAIYADEDGDSVEAGVFLNTKGDADSGNGCDSRPAHLGAVACAPGVPCNVIAGNIAETGSGTATTGAAVLMQRGSVLRADRVQWRDNSGGHALRLTHENPNQRSAVVSDCLFTGNSVSRQLILTDDDAYLELSDCTMAGNAIAAPHVIEVGGDLFMHHSILWQPGKISLAQVGGHRAIDHVVASERMSLDGGNSTSVIEADPRFVDPAGHDYHLRVASPAIDFAPAVAGDDVDLDGSPRDRNLPVHAERNGIRDLGAFERQTLLPIVLNGTFDTSVEHWLDLSPGASAFDPTQNEEGPPGSGSLTVDVIGPTTLDLAVRSQCVHLPGPGEYLLVASGRGAGTTALNRDIAIMKYEYRRDGGEPCDFGAADTAGEAVLSVNSSWQELANPIRIAVPPAQWTVNSSIRIVLVVRDGGVIQPRRFVGGFDGVLMDVVSLDGSLFADGFE